jgi:hypothetical protein
MYTKTKRFIFLLISTALAMGSISLLSCSENDGQVVSSPQDDGWTDVEEVKVTAGHQDNIKLFFQFMFGDNFINGTSAEKLALQSEEDNFDSGDEIIALDPDPEADYKAVKKVFDVVKKIFKKKQPNWGKIDYKLLKEEQKQLDEIQKSIDDLSMQIKEMKLALEGLDKELDIEVLNLTKEQIYSAIMAEFENIDTMNNDLINCEQDVNVLEDRKYFNCVNDIATSDELRSLADAFYYLSALTLDITLQQAENFAVTADDFSIEGVKKIMVNFLDSQLCLDYRTFYSDVQNEISRTSADMESYNNALLFVQTLSSVYLIKWYVITSQIILAQSQMQDFPDLFDPITPTSKAFGIPGIGGDYKTGESIGNTLTMFEAAINSLGLLSMNFVVSDMNLSNLTCDIINQNDPKFIKHMSFPFQSPRYWTNLAGQANDLPSGSWTNNCILYRWAALPGSYTDGSWDGDPLVVNCAPITIPGAGSCGKFDADPVEMSLEYSTFCNPGSDVSAQYLPTLNGFTDAPTSYGYCSSVNTGYYYSSYTDKITSVDYSGIAPYTICHDGTDDNPPSSSDCGKCQWLFFYDASYFGVSEDNQNFPSTCSYSPGQFGIWASYDMFNDGGWGGSCGSFEQCSGGPYQFVVDANTTMSPAHTNSGAFVFEGEISTTHSDQWGNPKGASNEINFACYTGDDQCHFNNETANVLCYGLDSIQINQDNVNGTQANFAVTTNGCVQQYGELTNMTSTTWPLPSIVQVPDFSSLALPSCVNNSDPNGPSDPANACSQCNTPVDLVNLTNTASVNATYNNLSSENGPPVCQVGSGFGIAAVNDGISSSIDGNFLNIEFSDSNGSVSGNFPLMLTQNSTDIFIAASCYENDSSCSIIVNSDSQRNYSQICLGGKTIIVQTNGYQSYAGDGINIVAANSSDDCNAQTQPYCNDTGNSDYNDICIAPGQ